MISWSCVTFLDELVPSKLYSWNVSPKHALAMNRHILVSHFVNLGRFRDAVLPDFLDFLLVQTIT